MTYAQMRNYASSLNVTVFSDPLPGSLKGLYDEEIQTIIIDRRLTYRQKRCTLVHELFHWSYGDDACETIGQSRAETRTRRHTALTLIDTIEYQAAEAMYDADPYQIANELDVTLQVIDDYRAILDEQRRLVTFRHDWGDDVLVSA
ncbi:ImmA/IrrE family metallo-endopeptidase [Bifidobacterium aemilianum]|uniref:ImmA/IrrE family metallo-endopeptidase n=1 Tax=Bifidobacterium aemilianum TaxID=2493120 RepID=A0A366KBD3_9BIFI|nr:ImmA/IrrE family metallo-endopeptidase [Bifidobacterium aemilianum]RBP98488.1 ImmA/IrrE family metallo-endopeptidase [Bifidobacterium aemilianum]